MIYNFIYNLRFILLQSPSIITSISVCSFKIGNNIMYWVKIIILLIVVFKVHYFDQMQSNSNRGYMAINRPNIINVIKSLK